MVSNQQESQQDRMLLGAAQYRFQPGHWDLGFRIGLLDEQIFYSNQVADIVSDGRANAQELGMSWSRQLAARWRWDGQLALRREQAHSTAYAHDLVFWEQRAQSSLQWSPDTHGAFAWMSYRIVTQRNGCLCSPSFALFIKTAKHSPMGTNGSGRRERELPDIMPGPR